MMSVVESMLTVMVHTSRQPVRPRVYELAKELGVDSRVVTERLRAMGKFCRSASSEVSLQAAAAVREQVRSAPRPEPSDQQARRASPARPVAPRPPVSVQPSPVLWPPAQAQLRLRDLSDLERHLLETHIAPPTAWSPREPFRPAQIQQARDVTLQWADLMFEEKEIRRWCCLHWPLQADVAAQFRRIGMSPEQAVQRIWYGRLHPQRPTLAQQVQGGDITGPA